MKLLKIALLTSSILITQAIQADGTLTRDNGSEPASIDPQKASEAAGAAIIIDTFEGLTALGKDGNVIPGVAKSWETSNDGKIWIFHLRNSQWSDGTPVTAQDFIYAWKRAVNPKTASPLAFLFAPIKNAAAITSGKISDVDKLGVKAVDDHTIQITLESPTPYLPQLLKHFSTYPVPRHVVEKYGNQWTLPEHIVSNGAFHLTKWVPQSEIVAEKSNRYWDKDHVSLDKVIYFPIEKSSSSLSRYRAGELDIASVPPEQIKWVRENLGKELHISDYLGTYYYGLNLTKPPFKDNPKLRKALSIALDRDTLVNKVLDTGQKPAYSFVPPQTANSKPYQPEWASWPRAKQIDEAKRLYQEAGYSKDKPLTFDLYYNTSEEHKKIAIAASNMWKSILGVQVHLINQEWKVFLNTRHQKQTDAFRGGWIGGYNDPNTFLEIFKTNSGTNDIGYSNPKFDTLLKDASEETNLAKRAELLYQATKILGDDVVIPVLHYTNVMLVKPNVEGARMDITGLMPSRYIKKVQ